MRIYTNGVPTGHANDKPYIDIEPSLHGVNVFFSDPSGYYIARREEISNAEIIQAINEILSRPRSERVF